MQLKPCPCCGGQARMAGGDTCFWAVCTVCELQTRALHKDYHADPAGEVLAIWNRRPAPTLDAAIAPGLFGVIRDLAEVGMGVKHE